MMSQTSKRELVAEVQARYRLSDRTARCQILDELVATTSYHRKYAIGLLNQPPKRRTRKRREGRAKSTAGGEPGGSLGAGGAGKDVAGGQRHLLEAPGAE
jgi:hypothetical protein